MVYGGVVLKGGGGDDCTFNFNSSYVCHETVRALLFL